MGCNFFIYNKLTKEKIHIGKRSAAGYYCWNCKTTLCKRENEGVHLDCNGCWESSHKKIHDCKWFDRCSYCGCTPDKENLFNSSAERELGMNTLAMEKKKGVRRCFSFTFALEPYKIDNIMKKNGNLVIVSEYYYPKKDDQMWDLDTFKKTVMLECLIKFMHMVGIEFSQEEKR